MRSFANRCLETDGASKSGAGSRRIRFQKGRSENGISALSIKRRSRCGRYTSASKKSNKLRSISLPVTASVARKKKNSKSQGFTSGTKGGILKRRVKDANNIKQAFLISKKLLNSQNQHFEEFILPEKWIKESQKRKKVIKAKSGGEVSSSSASVEDLAMERLVRAFKTAKLLYPEKFAEYFPDFIHSFEPGNNKEKRVKQNGVKSKRMYPKTIKNEEDALIFDKNIAPDSGEEQSKRIRKVSKFLREYSTDSGITKKKLTGSSKISRSNGPSAGTSGLRKRSKKSDSPSDRSILSKSQQSGRVIGDSGEIIGVLTSKRRRCAKSALRSNVSAKVTDVNVPVIQNNIEDSATESSSDESGNVRSSKRHRAQSGFYKYVFLCHMWCFLLYLKQSLKNR